MKDVWHLFCSQVSALRWWLLVWITAVTAWAVARWTYLTTWRESWPKQEDYCWYGLLILSALLVVTLVHLHPPAKTLAGWRAWPQRCWKVPAAQFLFVLVFLIVLPGAAEMAFLLHPRLRGFTGTGLTQWLMRSLWPLPLALGLAACSHTLRRFILDALILAALVIAAETSWKSAHPPGILYDPVDLSFRVLTGLFRWLPFAGGLVWLMVCRRWISHTRGRVAFFLTPVLCGGLVVVLRITGHPDPDYMPEVANDAELAKRISFSVNAGSAYHAGSFGPMRTIAASVQVNGLLPDETASVSFWKARLTQESITFKSDPSGWWESSGTFGSGVPEDAGKTSSVSEANMITLPAERLKQLDEKPCRFEATAVVSISRPEVVFRFPLQLGAGEEEPDQEIVVEFVGSGSEAIRRDIKGANAGSASDMILQVLWRRFGNALYSYYAKLELFHKPTHARSPLTEVASLGDSFSSFRLTGSFSQRETYIFSGGLKDRALTHPEEFEIHGERPIVKNFVREVTADDFQTVSLKWADTRATAPKLNKRDWGNPRNTPCAETNYARIVTNDDLPDFNTNTRRYELR